MSVPAIAVSALAVFSFSLAGGPMKSTARYATFVVLAHAGVVFCEVRPSTDIMDSGERSRTSCPLWRPRSSNVQLSD
jgi:hypothetical protein